jgi:hypothetical protein
VRPPSYHSRGKSLILRQSRSRDKRRDDESFQLPFPPSTALIPAFVDLASGIAQSPFLLRVFVPFAPLPPSTTCPDSLRSTPSSFSPYLTSSSFQPALAPTTARLPLSRLKSPTLASAVASPVRMWPASQPWTTHGANPGAPGWRSNAASSSSHAYSTASHYAHASPVRVLPRLVDHRVVSLNPSFSSSTDGSTIRTFLLRLVDGGSSSIASDRPPLLRRIDAPISRSLPLRLQRPRFPSLQAHR